MISPEWQVLSVARGLMKVRAGIVSGKERICRGRDGEKELKLARKGEEEICLILPFLVAHFSGPIP